MLALSSQSLALPARGVAVARRVQTPKNAPVMRRGMQPVAAAQNQEVNTERRAQLGGALSAFAAAAALAVAPQAKADDGVNVASSRMSYSRFLEYLDMDRIKTVDLYENGTIAIVEAVSTNTHRPNCTCLAVSGLPVC